MHDMRNPVHATKILSCADEVKAIYRGEFPSPRTVELFVTSDCNHRCVGCHTKALRGGDVKNLDPDLAAGLLEEWSAIGVRGLEISGVGEPLLYPYINEIIGKARSLGLSVGLLTNGSRLHEADVELLLRACRFIRVSYDSCDAGLYRKLHGADDLERVEKNIAEMVSLKKRLGLRATIGMKTLLSALNDNQIADIAARANLLGADYIQFKALRNSRAMLTRAQSAAADRKINEIRGALAKRIGVLGGARKERLSQPCRLSPLHPVVDPEGNLYVCPYYTHHPPGHKIGSLKNRSFSQLWGGASHRRAISGIQTSICNIFDCPLIPLNNFASAAIGLDEMHLDFI